MQVYAGVLRFYAYNASNTHVSLEQSSFSDNFANSPFQDRVRPSLEADLLREWIGVPSVVPISM